MFTIRFKAELYKPDSPSNISTWTVLTLPKEASMKLPSRGTSMVEGTLNGSRFRVPLEPDGLGSHWFRVDETLRGTTAAKLGDEVELEIEPTKYWPEPEVPADLTKALAADSEARTRWEDITPLARWDWIRWLETVKLAETRKERPEKLCSMLKSGKRRPCCFNRAVFTPPKTAKLL